MIPNLNGIDLVIILVVTVIIPIIGIATAIYLFFKQPKRGTVKWEETQLEETRDNQRAPPM